MFAVSRVPVSSENEWSECLGQVIVARIYDSTLLITVSVDFQNISTPAFDEYPWLHLETTESFSFLLQHIICSFIWKENWDLNQLFFTFVTLIAVNTNCNPWAYNLLMDKSNKKLRVKKKCTSIMSCSLGVSLINEQKCGIVDFMYCSVLHFVMVSLFWLRCSCLSLWFESGG